MEQSQPKGRSEEWGWQWLYVDFIEVLVKTWDGWWYLQVKVRFYLSSGEHLVKNLEFTEYFSCRKWNSELRVLIEAEGEAAEVRIHIVVAGEWAKDAQK